MWCAKALNNTYTIDANILIRYFTRDNEILWAKAASVVAAMDSGRVELICDPITLGEIVFVLSSVGGLDRSEICKLLAPVLEAKGFRVPDKQVYSLAIQLYGTSVPHFGDACACARALGSSNGKLLSFDKTLSNVPGIERMEEL